MKNVKHLSKLIFILSFAFLVSAFSPKGKIVSEWSGQPATINHDPVHETRAYQIYNSQHKSERAKINYLINLVRYSKYRFWRNGRVVRGRWAGKAFEYKMKKYGKDISTAEEWVDKIGTHSNKTGKEYYVIYPDDSTAPSKLVFRNELDRLEQYENKLLIGYNH